MKIIWTLLFVYATIILIAGLRPYSSYSENWVNFDEREGHTEFKHYGLAEGALKEPIANAINMSMAIISLSVKLTPAIDNRFQVLAEIDSPDSDYPLIIGQWQSRFIVRMGRDYRDEFGLPQVSADLERYNDSFIDIAITLTPTNTTLFAGDNVVKHGPAMQFEQSPTRITIGNAPDGNHGWTGAVRNFQIRSMLRNNTLSQYQFDNNKLPKVFDAFDESHYLSIPAPGKFPDRRWIGKLSIEQLMRNNISDVILNLLGFIPLGFLIYAMLYKKDQSSRLFLHVAIATFIGFALSLAIETTQSYIPGRSPHIHDLVLNTLGALLGALLLFIVVAIRHYNQQSFIPTQTSIDQHLSENPEHLN